MSDFPALNTGAVMQYPAQRSVEYATQVLRFVDGAEQRFAGYETSLRRWVIRLEKLSEDEMNRIVRFYSVQAGASGTFSFTDPWDGTVYPSCSFEDDEMTVGLNGENHLKTTLTIRANRS
jgi:phage-related protein